MSPRVDLLLSGVWTDKTIDILQSRDKSPGLTINRGRSDWQSSLSYGTLDCGIRNDGTYSPRNPTSALYGIIGPNTGIRASYETLADPFSTAASNGWGTAPTGQAYLTSGGVASAYSVSSGTGRIAISALSSAREVYTDDISAADVIVRAKLLPGAVATGTSGHSIQMGVTARRADSSNFYYAVVAFLVGGTADLWIFKRVAGSATLLDIADGDSLTYTAGSTFELELTVCGDRLEARAWDTAAPTTVMVAEAADSTFTDAGSVGVYTGLTSAISNALPLTVQFDDLAVLNPRFCGEIPSWPPRWDPTGTDVWVPIQGSGIVRRLSRSGPLKSALRGYLEGLAADPDADQPVAGWMLEDGAFATSGAPIFGTSPMIPFRGAHTSGNIWTSIQWGKGDLGPAFPPVLSRGGASLSVVYGQVSMPFLMTTWYIDHVFASGTGGQVTVMDVNPNYLGSTTSGWPQMEFDPANTDINVSFGGLPTSIDYPQLFDGLPHYVRWTATANGANTDWSVSVDGVEVLADSDVWSLDVVEYVALVSETTTGTPVAQGYVTVWADDATAEAIEAGMGYPGESAADRVRRLCGQAGVECVIVGDESQPMGVQRLAPLVDHLQDCEIVDQGIVFEPRALLGVGYRTGRSLLNQTAIALDYDAGDISPPFEPEDDDQLRRNDITVTDALGGASYRWQVTDGPLSISNPPDGAGPYEQQVSAAIYGEADLRELAAWLAHLGTWDEARYPRVTFNLMRLSNAAEVSAADMGTASEVSNLPAWLPPDPAGLMVRGTSEYLDEYNWGISWLCTPSGPYAAGVWEESRYDSSASTLATAFVAGTDTSMLVAVEAGKTHWVTGSGSPQFNLEVGVSGARVTVSAITAAATPTSTVGTVDHDSNASLTPGLPASVSDGDVLLLLAAIRNSGTGSPDTPTGWTRLDVFPSGANVQLFGIIADSTSAPTVSFTGGALNASTSARIVRLAGMKVHDINELVLISAAQLNSSAQDIDYPYLNVRQPNGVALYCGWKQDDWTSVGTISGATEVIDNATTLGDDQGIVMDFVKMTSAVDIAPGTFTVTGGAAAISRGAVALIRDSYQTFTVSSTIANGVTKTVIAGTKVSLWTPGRYAL